MNDYQTNLHSYLNSLLVFKRLAKIGVLTDAQLTIIEANLRAKYSIKVNSIYTLHSVAN
jgi:hypothetical protein